MMSSSKVYATYRVQTPISLEAAAEMIATEQSTGTFVHVPGETDELRALHRATVERVVQTGSATSPALAGSRGAKDETVTEYPEGEVTVSFPYHNMGASIPNLLAAVAGNLYELSQLSGIRLMDIEVPEEFFDRYKGPKFGISGTRRLAGVESGPIIGTIVKPSIGLSPDNLRALVRELAESGIDFVKDDELNANPPYFPFAEKVRIVMEEIHRAADKTGKQMMYAFNITGDIEEMLTHHDEVLKSGGTCVMVSIHSVGWAALAYLRERCELPIHGHRNQWGWMTRHPLLGMEFRAYQKLCRLAGVDHLHTNGMDNKFYESNESVAKSVRDCLTAFGPGYDVMPVLSSGQWAASAVKSYQTLGTVDVIHLAGGGIMAHPDGVTAGVESMRQGWEAALSGQALDEYAKTHQELTRAIAKFGGA